MTDWTERTHPALDDNITEHLYERAFAGFHPAYFDDVSVLGQDGWEPPWGITWGERANVSATWTERAVVSAVWVERT